MPRDAKWPSLQFVREADERTRSEWFNFIKLGHTFDKAYELARQRCECFWMWASHVAADAYIKLTRLSTAEQDVGKERGHAERRVGVPITSFAVVKSASTQQRRAERRWSVYLVEHAHPVLEESAAPHHRLLKHGWVCGRCGWFQSAAATSGTSQST